MDKARFLELHKQYCQDTVFLSFTKRDHPAYIELAAAGPEAIPWALERLQDTVGHDRGDDFDSSNSPWLSTELLHVYSNGECLAKMPGSMPVCWTK
jgi:hypothetical protein